ncbi:PEP-CTERM-box response regulator transcription factor [Aquisalimonas asiatica]|uniref:PEP-CTERM-box response regulator transcription factor n=1 Tax=Aquisalimonas asiatica TaxID=406100 RepID=UPI003CCBFE20
MDESVRKLLIVEDDPGLKTQLRWCFQGFEVLVAEDREQALAQVERHSPAIVTLDLGLPPDPANATEGLAALEQILSLRPETKVIVVTGSDDRENALQAIARGAYDFYQKPVDGDVLQLIAERAHRVYELEEENRRLMRQGTGTPLEGVITADPQMLRVCKTIEKIAPVDATVLLLGDSGTGKEVLARAVHQLSARRDQRFVAINCAAIPENLLESELFGYEKGAFTGATRQTIGRIEYAEGGTLFLDEVGDLPLPLQAKLLRFLQERVIERLGGRGEIPVDVRVVCATHQKLDALMADGRFREDLYYRISELSVNIPPLGERHGDAVLLAHHFLDRFRRQHGKGRSGFAPDALAAIERYSWPGNVRELENIIRKAVIMADGPQITADDLGFTVPESNGEAPIKLRDARDQAESSAIRRALSRTNGNIAQAADVLGVSRPTLYSLLNKFGLK